MPGLPRPRPSRLESKNRPGSSISSISTASTSGSSASTPPSMTDLVPPSKRLMEEERPVAKIGSESQDSCNLQDMELMMNWCTRTYKSMSRDEPAEALWQTTIPQISLRFPSLRHGLLALSALQLAGANRAPQRKWRYLVTAREHHAEALKGIHPDGEAELSQAQCNAAFALCCVLLVWSFGYCLIDDGMEEDGKPDVLDEFLEVFELTRWIVRAMMTTMERVAGGELWPLVRPATLRPTMPNMSRLVVRAMQRQNDIEASHNPAHERGVYENTIEHLSHCLEQLMNGGEPKDFVFCWTFRIPGRFQDLVREREPFALVVLAHYAVTLHHLRDTWWMGNWGARILNEIVDILGTEWRELLSWPIDATGCSFPGQ
ncbi:hypothetical protein N7533_012812 [Penicillium manginii]|uniref:uncharacterized protein n=1 Tax=Penicillium manginii TaxID=203109 RepID=UPI002547D16A|nr:uncharacterized protein N7533_012812 [Penicillium manginii]KAJ5740028.1 hypothetical protein N7533_012812 [Penicillium manginii]